jgi:ABC-type lipoprotein release transport system permease subunit
MMRWLLHLTRRLRRQPLVTASVVTGVALAVALALAATLATNALAVLGLRATLAALPQASQNIQLTRTTEPFGPAFRTRASRQLGDLVERVHETRYVPQMRARREAPLLTNGVRIRTQESLQDHVDVTGRWPQAGADRSALDCEQHLPLEAAASAEVLEGTGFQIGDRLCLDNSVPVIIVGSFTAKDPTEDYWGSDLRPIRGEREAGGQDAGALVLPLMIEQADFEKIATFFEASDIVHIFRVETRLERVTVENLGDIDTRLRSFRAQLNTLQPRPLVLTGIDRAIGTFNERFQLLQSALATLLLGIITLAIIYLILVGTLATEQQSAEIAILRSRGGSTFQLLSHQAGQALGMMLPGIVAGGGLAVLAVLFLARTEVFRRLGNGAFPWHLTISNIVIIGAILLIALGGLLLAARPALVMSLVTLRQERARPPARTGWRRIQVDGMLILFAVLGWLGLRRYGSGLTTLEDGQTRFNLLVLSAPILMMIGGAIIFLRIFPLAVRGLGHVLERRRGIVAALSAWQLARNPLVYGRLVLLLILTVGLGVYSQVVANTLGREQLRQALQEAGADIRIAVEPGTDPQTLLAQYPNTTSTLLTVLDADVVRRSQDVVAQSLGSTLLVGVDGSSLANVLALSGSDDDQLQAGLRLLSAGSSPPLGLPLPAQTRALAIRIKGTGSGFTVYGKLAGLNGVRQIAFGAPTEQWRDLEATIPADLQAPITLQSLIALPDGRLTDTTSQNVFFAELAALPPGGKVVLSDFQRLEDWEAVGLSFGDARSALAPGSEAGRNSVRLSFGALAAGRWATLRVHNDTTLPVYSAREAGNLRFTPGQTVLLSVGELVLTGTVQGRTGRLPGVDDVRQSVLLADRGQLTALMTYGLPATLPPTELRLALQHGAQISAPADAATKEAALRIQAADPLGNGVRVVLLLGSMCAIVLSMVGVVTYAALSIQARQVELAVLSALGLSSREVLLLIAAEQGFVLGGGVVAGIVVGLLLALTTRPFLGIVTGSPVTTPALFDWPALVLLVGSIVAALAIALALLLASLRSRGLVRTLRLGEAQ